MKCAYLGTPFYQNLFFNVILIIQSTQDTCSFRQQIILKDLTDQNFKCSHEMLLCFLIVDKKTQEEYAMLRDLSDDILIEENLSKSKYSTVFNIETFSFSNNFFDRYSSFIGAILELSTHKKDNQNYTMTIVI